MEEKYQVNQAQISVKNGPFRRPKAHKETKDKKGGVDNSISSSRPSRKKNRAKNRKKDWGSNQNISRDDNSKIGGKKLLDRIAPRNLNPRDF